MKTNMNVNRLGMAMHAVFGAALLLGCVSQPGIPSLEVRPVTRVQHGGDQADGYYQLGRYYQSQQRQEPAIDAYSKALAIDAGHVGTHDALGVIYAGQGKFEQALSEFSAAIAVAPSAARLYNNLGYAYLLQGRQGEAIAAFEKASALDPSNPRTWNNLGLAFAKRGDAGRSREAFEHATELAARPSPVTSSPAAAQRRVATAASNSEAFTVLRAASSIETHPASDGKAPSIATRAEADGFLQPAVEPVIAAVAAAASGAASPVPAADDPATEATIVQTSPAVFELRTTIVPPQASAPRWAEPLATAPYRLEISNGNGVTGMARKVGQLLANGGQPAARLTNQKPFQQGTTEIQYRDGFGVAASALSSRLSNRPTTVRTDQLRWGIDVRLVLGKDLPGNLALLTVIAVAAPRIDAASADERERAGEADSTSRALVCKA